MVFSLNNFFKNVLFLFDLFRHSPIIRAFYFTFFSYMAHTGIITKIIGVVIDVEFKDGYIPAIYEALDVE